MSGQNKQKKKAAMIRRVSWVLFVALTATPLIIRTLSGAPTIPLLSSYQPISEGISRFLTLPVPIILLLIGITNFWIYTKLIRRITKQDEITRGYALLLFAITPVLITIHTTSLIKSFSLTMMLSATYLLTIKKLWSELATIIVSVAMMLLTPVSGIIMAAAITAKSFFMRKKTAPLLLAVVIGASAGIIRSSRMVLTAVHPLITGFSEFGDYYGHSIFIILLAIIGIVLLWDEINKRRAFFFLTLLAVSLPITGLRGLAASLTAIYAASGLTALAHEEWSYEALKTLTIVLLISLGLFVAISHQKALINAEPTKELMRLVSVADDKIKIMVPDAYCEAIRELTGREVTPIPEALADAFLMSDAKPWLKETTYLLLTPDFKPENDKGLRFLISHNKNFVRISSEKGFRGNEYELWLYLGGDA